MLVASGECGIPVALQLGSKQNLGRQAIRKPTVNYLRHSAQASPSFRSSGGVFLRAGVVRVGAAMILPATGDAVLPACNAEPLSCDWITLENMGY